MIKYHKLSLFDAPKNSILGHACNAQGVWSSGIAVPFKEKFPNSFKEYHRYCLHVKNAPGTSLLCDKENDHFVLCLMTSGNFGPNKSNIETILDNTMFCIDDFLTWYIESKNGASIYTNKFNSGLFCVPWEKTEAIIEELSNRYNVIWNVCDPNLEE